MNEIIDRAKSLVRQYKPLLIVAFTSLLLYEIINDMLQGLPPFMLLAIAFICIPHAEVVFGLKVLKGEMIDPKADSRVGFTKFKQLFSTYLCLDLVEFILLFLFFTIMVGVLSVTGADYFKNLLTTIQQEANYGIYESLNQWAITFTSFTSLVLILTNLIVNCMFLPATYLLEEGKAHGFGAMKMALKLTKGHRKHIFIICARYTAFSLIFGLLDVLVTSLVPGIFISTLFSVILLFSAIRVYRMEYCVSKALLYEKMRGSLYV